MPLNMRSFLADSQEFPYQFVGSREAPALGGADEIFAILAPIIHREHLSEPLFENVVVGVDAHDFRKLHSALGRPADLDGHPQGKAALKQEEERDVADEQEHFD